MKLNRSATAILSALTAAAVAGSAACLQAADSPGLDLARQLNDAFVSVAAKVSPSVVVVKVTERPQRGVRRRFEETGEGSGIIVTEDGYILTNNHVVDNADTITVQLKDGRTFKAVVKGTDPRTDIAVIKIRPADRAGTKLTAARLGNSDKLRVGEFVVAIGHPYELEYSVTVGHVSAIQRQLPPSPGDSSQDDLEYIQTDAGINPGNSGGPLINLDGEVIGVNAMIEADTMPSTEITLSRGIGLAIPINEAKEVENRLISDGKFTRSRIGIEMERESSEGLAFLDLEAKPKDGVEVLSIVKDGPASKSELKVKDLIVAVDGSPVKSGRDLRKEVSFKRPGETITLTVLRGSKRLAIKVTTDAEPVVEVAATPLTESDYGFSIKTLTTDLADEFQVDATSGIIVTDVQRRSPADSKGVRAGDIITKFNNKPVSSARDFIEKLKAVDVGQQWTMEVKSKGSVEARLKVFHVPDDSGQ